MKYFNFRGKIIILLSLFTSFSLAFKYQPENNFPLFGKVIIVDPGHGGLDPGSVYKDNYEKNYNLDFSFYLKKELENLGATVLMTRYGDYDLSSPGVRYRKKSDFNNRIKIIDEWNADLYISLHMNYLNDSSYFGSQAFYSKVNEDNQKIADILQFHLNEYFSFDKKTKKISDDKYMFKRIKTRGVLLEYGFISSYKDRSNLEKENYKRDLAKVIVKGIIEYFT